MPLFHICQVLCDRTGCKSSCKKIINNGSHSGPHKCWKNHEWAYDTTSWS